MLARFAKPFNPQLNNISRFEILRRLHSQPNPGGVPVLMTSPGSNVMNSLTYDRRVATSKIILAVELF